MVFSSLLFLFFFFPAVMIGHTFIKPRLRNGFLFAASIVFYAFGDLRYLPLFLFLTVFNWASGLAIGRWKGAGRRAASFVSISVNVLSLIVFKYIKLFMPFLGFSPDLPLGISFFVFQSISYLADVSRGTVHAERGLTGYGAYILMFPQLIAGPIVRYSDVSAELRERTVDSEALEKGMELFLCGMAAKVLIANRMGSMYADLTAIEGRGMLASFATLLALSFQYYFDFWGYSMMAQGMGRMMGFRFPDNFRHPFRATSMRIFWRRWHITLGSWLTSYIYIPLGGSRHGTARKVLATLITWAISGLWHGAGWNFLLWGLYFGVMILLEGFFWGKWIERHPVLGRIYTLLAFNASWFLFTFSTTAESLAFMREFLRPEAGPNVFFTLLGYAPWFVIAALVSFLPEDCAVLRRLSAHSGLKKAALFALLVLCVMSLVQAQYNPFIYFRF